MRMKQSNWMAIVLMYALVIAPLLAVRPQAQAPTGRVRVRDRILTPGGQPRAGKVTFVLLQAATGPDGLIPAKSSVTGETNSNGWFDVWIYPSTSINPQGYYNVLFQPTGSISSENLGVYSFPSSAAVLTLLPNLVTDTNLAARYKLAADATVQNLATTAGTAGGLAGAEAATQALAGTLTDNAIPRWDATQQKMVNATATADSIPIGQSDGSVIWVPKNDIAFATPGTPIVQGLPLSGGSLSGPVSSTSTITAKQFDNGGRVFDIRAKGANPALTASQNTAYIQTTIDAAAAQGGGDVLVNDGVYKTNAPIILESNIRLIGNGTIKADNGTNYQNIISSTSKSNVYVQGIMVDGNQANRTSATVATLGVNLISCTGCVVRDVTVTGTLGYNGAPGVGVAVSGTSDGCVVDHVTVKNAGTLARTSDGIYTSSSKTIITNCLVENATDTSFVIEGASNSGIVNCVSINTPAGAGITNYLSTDVSGSFIDGLTVKNWNAAVTGGILIGTVGTQAGDLTDLNISNVIITAEHPTYGNGPAIRVNNGSTNAGARVKRITINNPRIYEASTQGIAVVATGAGGGVEEVKIQGGEIRTLAASTTAVSVQNGSTAEINGTTLIGATFGVTTTHTSSALIKNCVFPSYGSWAAYAYDTSTITANYNHIASGGSGQLGSVVGATMNESFNLALNGLDYAGSGDAWFRDLTTRSVRLANANYLSGFTSDNQLRGLLGITADNITRLRAAGSLIQLSDQNATLAWLNLSATEAAFPGIVSGAKMVVNNYTPSAANSTGRTGQIAWDGSYIYICVATDTWKRVAISTW
jgi:hypothetical protein